MGTRARKVGTGQRERKNERSRVGEATLSDVGSQPRLHAGIEQAVFGSVSYTVFVLFWLGGNPRVGLPDRGRFIRCCLSE